MFVDIEENLTAEARWGGKYALLKGKDASERALACSLVFDMMTLLHRTNIQKELQL